MSSEVEYRPVVDDPRYRVGSDGTVIGPSGRTLSPGLDTYGYPQVGISRGARSRRVTRKVHRLVAEAFIGPRPSPDHQVAHWDGNMLNNRVENLRWATAKENIADKYRHDRVSRTRGEIDGMAKLTANQVCEIRSRYAAGGITQRELGEMYGITQSHVSALIKRKNWGHLE